MFHFNLAQSCRFTFALFFLNDEEFTIYFFKVWVSCLFSGCLVYFRLVYFHEQKIRMPNLSRPMQLEKDFSALVAVKLCVSPCLF